MSKAGCIDETTFDDINAEESKCKIKEGKTACVCNTELCNDGKEEENGVENIIPQFGMILLLIFSVFYFTS